ncbi:MAG: hypothetical protein LBB25_02785 [Holosporaceae bacterium]|jgi:hypothetical protein|nr:hypothetical protein [Holosporaceae bacterium]
MQEAVVRLGEIAREKEWKVEIENKFGDQKKGYVGLHFNIGYQTPEGMIVTEVQIHTKRNLEVKEALAHPIYEQVRVSRDQSVIDQGNNANTILFAAAMIADLGGEK